MNNTGLNHSGPWHVLSLVNAALILDADWLPGDETSMVLISLPMGGSESYFTWDAL